MKRTILFFLVFLGSFGLLQANNIQVNDVEVIEDEGLDWYTIRFDLSWENSWRTSTHESNYDAAWIFVKWKTRTMESWQHLGSLIDSPPANIPAGCEIIMPPDGKGVFVQRSSNGIGNIEFKGVEIVSDMGILAASDEFEVCVFAIEMVFVPEGPFQLGDGSTLLTFEAGNSGNPYTISSENALTLGGTSTSNLSNWDNFESSDDFNYNTTRTLPAEYPKGFAAFYCMKYELSQGQYAAFLNTLYLTSSNERWPSHYNESGQSIGYVGLPLIYKADVPERAANFLDWIDLAWYADWSGLRPMSELEFEKACRGPKEAVEGEYAWGNTRVQAVPYEILNAGEPEEVVSNPAERMGNANWLYTRDNYVRPLNNGWAAASVENPSREEAGATFYGIMEMSGNQYEVVVGVGTEEGRAFNGGVHGDGYVNILGVPQWPATYETVSVAIARGVGSRGGSFQNAAITISSRLYMYEDMVDPGSVTGGRFVRSNF